MSFLSRSSLTVDKVIKYRGLKWEISEILEVCYHLSLWKIVYETLPQGHKTNKRIVFKLNSKWIGSKFQWFGFNSFIKQIEISDFGFNLFIKRISNSL